MGGGRRWSSVGSRLPAKERREKRGRIGMGSQRGGWVLGEGERVGGVGKLTNVGDKCGCVCVCVVGGGGGGGGGGVGGTSVGGQVWVCLVRVAWKERRRRQLEGGFKPGREGGRGGQVWGTSVGGVQSAWKERTWNGGFFLELSNLE